MSIQQAGSSAEALEVFRRHWAYLQGSEAAKSLWRKLAPHQRQELGNSLHESLALHGRAVEMWVHLKKVSTERAVVDLAVKLFSYPVDEADWLLREMGELPIDQDAAQSEAIARGDLVLIRNERSVFLNGADLEIDWGTGRVLFEFFLVSCEHAKQGKAIDRLSFGDVYENVVADRLAKLGKVPDFPVELLNYFEIAGLKSQRFTFPSEKIHIFDS